MAKSASITAMYSPSLMRQGVQKVASLLHMTRVRADDVPESVPPGQVPYLFTDRVIQHIDGLGAAPLYVADVQEGVVQQGQGLAAAGQEDVDGLALLPVAGHGGLMLGQGQPRAADSEPEVDDHRWHDDHQQQPHQRGDQPGMLGNADIAVENPEGGNEQKREHPAALLAKVLVLFPAVRRCGEVHPARALGGRRLSSEHWTSQPAGMACPRRPRW